MTHDLSRQPKIAIARAHEKACWNNLNNHRQTCEAWLYGEIPCLICRNVFDEWNIADEKLTEIMK